MTANQHFCLKWNNHQDTLISLFSSLLDSNTFVDCTLAASGKQIKAHKMILSACSPYFKEILMEHGDMHPIIILNNVQFTELVAIVEFMYRGEVNVSQDQLAIFLKAANALQIKGLTNDEEERVTTTEKNDEGDDEAGDAEAPKDLSVSDGLPSNYHSSDESFQEGSIHKLDNENDDSHSYPGPSNQTNQGVVFPDANTFPQNPTFLGLLQQQKRFSEENISPIVSFPGYSKMIQLRRPNATEKDANFKCDACSKFYRSKTSLNLHKRWECGKEPKFACPYCDKKCHQKGNLKVHIISRHRDRIQQPHSKNNT